MTMNRASLPKIILDTTLEGFSKPRRYRIIAEKTKYGFHGINYRKERFDGWDAEGQERWVEAGSAEGGLFLAAIGQELMRREDTKRVLVGVSIMFATTVLVKFLVPNFFVQWF